MKKITLKNDGPHFDDCCYDSPNGEGNFIKTCDCGITEDEIAHWEAFMGQFSRLTETVDEEYE